MTLHAQRSLAAQARMVLIVGPLGGMAAPAGHHLSGAWIEYAFTGRMTEGGMMSMTFSAHGIDLALEHGRMVGAVGRMAVVAGFCFLVLECSRFTALEGRFMAGTADMALPALEQTPVIPGVRRMAGHATVLLITHQMIMRRGHLIGDIRMTTQAVVDEHRPVAGVAVVAARGKRFVQDVAHHPLTVAAVRAVAGAAVTRRNRKARMLLANRRRGVASQAQAVAAAHQQVGVFRLMRLMAGRALTTPIRGMGVFELLRQVGMTTETGVRRTLVEQPIVVGRVGAVTTQAFTLLHRLMDKAAVLFGFFIGMTGVAQILDRFLQQALVAGDVRTVARQAVSPGRRGMIYFFLKGTAVMAGEAVRDGQSRPLRRQDQYHGRHQNHNESHTIHTDHQFVPPS